MYEQHLKPKATHNQPLRWAAEKQVSHPEDMTPRDFLMAIEFSPQKAHMRYPNALRLTLGGLFVSHSGADSQRIQDEIILPAVFDRLPADGYFMHSRRSGGARSYRELVQAALHWCDKFMVVISEMSLANEWVQAEVEWALARSRPILAVRIDYCTWEDLLQVLVLPSRLATASDVQIFDFTSDLPGAQRQLAEALDHLLTKLPRQGLSAEF